MLSQSLIHAFSIVVLSLPQATRGYIDPNTGGMLFQVLVVIFAAFSGFLFFFSRQIKSTIARFKRFLRRSEESTGEEKIE